MFKSNHSLLFLQLILKKNMQDNQNLLRYSSQLIELQGIDNNNLQATNTGFKKKNYLPPIDSKFNIQQLLNNMFPSLIFEKQGKHFKRNVSSQEGSRSQLQQLQIKLQQRLRQRQARKSGICPIREDVHNQLFDEIIRQCTINCPERGLLLLRIRDNLKMTFSAYQTLYQGSVVFGNRKAFASQIGLPELQQKIQQLKKKKIILENKRIVLENELQATEKSFRQLKIIEQRKRSDELTYLKNQSKHLEDFLHGI